MTTNEAAERLRGEIEGVADYFDHPVNVGELRALLAEPRARVERIRDRLLDESHDPTCDGSHQFCDPESVPDGPRIYAILDEEAAR